MIQFLRNIIAKRREASRFNKVMQTCGNVCRCPKCCDILNDQAAWTSADDTGFGSYHCQSCGHKSLWHFGIAPVPLLMGKAGAA